VLVAALPQHIHPAVKVQVGLWNVVSPTIKDERVKIVVANVFDIDL
jgi:hypothetical protein